MSLSTGTFVGRYRIVAMLGEGGMGEVYRALDTRLKREVALKLLPPGLVTDPERRRRFLLEAQASAALAHPRIATIYDADDAEGVRYLAMELVAGAPLTDRLGAGPLRAAEALALAVEVGEGLACAHARGIIHRDLKPANVLVDGDGHAKLIDFGIAKLLEPASGETATGMATHAGRAVGTPAYMAPEQARGEAVDARADIFGFGLLLYELLTGFRPFDRGSWPDTVAAVLRDPAPPLAAGTAGLSGEVLASLQRLLDSCLAKNAAGRPASMTDVLRDLDSARRLLGQPAVTAGSGVGVARPATAEKAAIVVLPFENLSPDPDNAFFADGLTEEIIVDLSRIRALRVISRTSAMHYKGTTKPLPVIARELSVQHVLEGSVRRAGSSLRITARLIDASTDAHLWAEKYTGTLDDVFEMQERVSRAIVGALEVHLTPGEARSLGRRAARDAAAYESYLRARVEIMHMSAASADRAIGVLDDALRRSPEDPLLRAGKAYALYQRTNFGGGTDEDLALAESMAAAVLREVPDLSLCHTVLGLVVGTKPGRAAEAVRHIERALDVAPDDMDALTWLSLFSSFMGGTERAAALAGRMIAISPVDPMSYVALWTVHFFDGRFAEALATADQMVALAPDVEGCRFCRIQPLLALGRLEEAAVVAAWAELDRASFWRRHTLLAWRAFRGDRDGVLALLTPEFLESNRRDLQVLCARRRGVCAAGGTRVRARVARERGPTGLLESPLPGGTRPVPQAPAR